MHEHEHVMKINLLEVYSSHSFLFILIDSVSFYIQLQYL